MKVLFITAAVLLLVAGSHAQIATYTGTGGTSTAVTGYPNETVTILNDIGFGSNTACSSGGLSGKTVNTSWSTYSTAGPHYYIKITPNTGYQLNVTGFNAGMRVSNTGPTAVRYAYSLDNGTTWTDDGVNHPLSNPGCGSSVASSWGGGTLPVGITSTANGIIVALFPFAPGGSTGTFQANYINVQGTVTPACTPPAITVSPSAVSFCAGGSTSVTASGAGATGTYTWSPSAGLSATTGAAVTVSPPATTIYTVTGYSSATCSNTATITVTVNQPPVVAAITGSNAVCMAGATTTLSNTTPGGTWSMSNAVRATISSSGIVTGILAGVDTAYYAVTNSCGTTTVTYPMTINPLPAAGTIIGADSVCAGVSVSLADPTATPGGTWSSALSSVATVSGSTVYGAGAGSTTIQYSVTTVCGTATTVHAITVNPLPYAGALSGADSVCYGTTITLASSVGGGAWSSSNSSILTVTSSGIVTGLSSTLSTASIVYTVSTFSCGSAVTTHAVTVKPQPFAGTITGAILCEQATTALTATAPGGSWAGTPSSIATLTTTGAVTGLAAGNAIITYAVTNSCGTAADTALVTVNPLPGPITGSANTCIGVNITLSDTTPGGIWSSLDPSIATVDAAGEVGGVYIGTTTISYTNAATGCYVTTLVTVNLSVPPSITIAASTPLEVCAGSVVSYNAYAVNGGTSPIFVWSVNNVIIAGGTSYTYTPADGDLVRCWFISSMACAVPDTASASLTMAVDHIATPALEITTSLGDTLCAGVATTFYPAPVDGGSSPVYQWSVNAVPVAVGSTFSCTPANGDIISCIMTSNAPCRMADQASASKIVTVSPFVAPVVSTGINPGPVACEGYPVVFTASQINGGVSPAYVWTVNGTNVGTGPVYAYQPANGDVVQVTLTSSFPCVSTPTAVTSDMMTVLPVTQPIGSVSASPGYIINEGGYDTFTVHLISGGGIAPQFQWFKNAIPITGATNTSYITNDLHTGDSINCVVTNTDQCSGVSVFNYIKVIVGDNVGVSNINSREGNLLIIPNPGKGSFVIKGKIQQYNGDAGIHITDIAGHSFYSGSTHIVNGEVDILVAVQLHTGAYLLSIETGAAINVLHLVID